MHSTVLEYLTLYPKKFFYSCKVIESYLSGIKIEL